MESLEQSKNPITQESFDDALLFVGEFSSALERYPHRLTGSEQETACARNIRSRLMQETDVPARMEAFKARPSLGRGVFPMIGLWFLISLALYFVSFAGGQVVGILLTAVALVNFLLGGTVFLLLFFGNKKLSFLLTQAVSYNVVSEFTKNRDRDVDERVIIIADNHDSMHGSVVGDLGAARRYLVLLAPICCAIFIVMCIIKMAIGADTAAKIVALVIIPALAGIVGISVLLLHYSPFKAHTRPNNGVATSVAMATFAYFAEQPELLPDDVRVVYASFGGENSCHSGSEAFKTAHPEFAAASVICLGDINCDDLRAVEYDPLRRVGLSTTLTAELSGAAHDAGYDLPTVPHRKLMDKLASYQGFAGGTFASAHMDCAQLVARGSGKPTDATVQKLFEICVRTVFRLCKNMPSNSGDSHPATARAAEMEIQAVQSK